MTQLSVAISEVGIPDLMSILLSYSYLSLDEMLEGTVSNIESTLEEGKMNVKKWRVSFETLFPGVDNNIPPASDLTLANAKNAVPTVDN